MSPCEPELKKEPLVVHHFHYTGWPDHGVPSTCPQILGLLTEMHGILDKGARVAPVIVHCSAGIGRTGTVIATDVVKGLVQEEGLGAVLDVWKVCKILRTQRAGMVQSVDQYKLIYQCLNSYIEAIMTDNR